MPIGLISEMGYDVGDVEVDPCGMPTEWFVSVLQRALDAAGVAEVQVESADLYELPQASITAVVDEMVTGSEFPMVLVDDRVVCVGGVRPEAVLGALATR